MGTRHDAPQSGVARGIGWLVPQGQAIRRRLAGLIGGDSAAGPLAELLAEDGMAGHAMLQPAAGSDRSLPLREIIIARALYRLGDHKHLARKSLESFTQDVRGHFARHASAILQAGRK
ncbi:MAG: hypothetical protein WBF17_22300 [Phycisphaerae bacterium]